MSINLTDEIEVKTKKGKLGSAKQIFLNGDQENLQQIGDKTHQLENAVKDITATGGASTADAVSYRNETSGMTAVTAQGAIDELVAKNKSQDATIAAKVEKSDVQASVSELKEKDSALSAELAKKANASDVTSKFTEESERVNAELAKKFNSGNIAQESGEAEDKVMSQKAVSTKLSDLSNQSQFFKDLCFGAEVNSNLNFDLVPYNLNGDINLLAKKRIPQGTNISIVSNNNYDDTITILYKNIEGTWLDSNKRIPASAGTVEWKTTYDIFGLKLYTSLKTLSFNGSISFSFKGTVEKLNEKIDKTDILQELGDAEDNVVSQKVVNSVNVLSKESSRRLDTLTGYNLDENFDSVLVQYNLQSDVNILTDRKIPSGTAISINSENSDTETINICFKNIEGTWLDSHKRIQIGTGTTNWTTNEDYYGLKIHTNKAGIHVKANIKANVSGNIASNTDIKKISDKLAEKLDKSNISQELGDAEDKVVSQKCITKELANVSAKDLPQYFKDEALSVSKRIKEKLVSNSLVYNIVTDTHERYWVKEDVLAYNNTFKNIKLVNTYVKSEGIINLGDMLSANQSDSGKYDSQDVVNEHLRNFSSRMHDAHDNCLFMLGNHDGLQGSVPSSNGSYPVLGVNSCCERPKTAPYFYVDKPTSQIRCIFLCAPYIQGEKEPWSFGKEQITWLIQILSELKEHWHAIFFSHTPLFSADMLNGDYADVAGIINAFCNHGSFTTSYSVSCDFSSQSNTKAVAWLCGHEHYDMVVTDSSYYSKYNLSIPIIIISCNYRYGSSGSVNGASYPARNQKDKTQDLWDTFIYNRGQGKIYIIRFGAGVDREINV